MDRKVLKEAVARALSESPELLDDAYASEGGSYFDGMLDEEAADALADKCITDAVAEEVSRKMHYATTVNIFSGGKKVMLEDLVLDEFSTEIRKHVSLAHGKKVASLGYFEASSDMFGGNDLEVRYAQSGILTCIDEDGALVNFEFVNCWAGEDMFIEFLKKSDGREWSLNSLSKLFPEPFSGIWEW